MSPIKVKLTLLLICIAVLVLSGCSLGQITTPSITPAPTATSTPTPLPLNQSKVYIEGNISWLNPEMPMGNVIIKLYGDGNTTPRASSQTDAQGHFTFFNVVAIKHDFGFDITMPSGDLICYEPEILENEWIKSVSAFYPSEDTAKIWMQNPDTKLKTGEIIYMNIVLKCP